jgi:hypothetical protein
MSHAETRRQAPKPPWTWPHKLPLPRRGPSRPRPSTVSRWSWLEFPAELGKAERGVLKAILAGQRAWTARDLLDSAYPGAVESLLAAGWVKPWDFPRYEAATLSLEDAKLKGVPVQTDPGEPTEPTVTLTEWAAERLGVSLQEEWSYRTVVRLRNAGSGKPFRKIRRRAAENVSRWRRSEVPPLDEPGAAAIIQPAPEKPLPPHVVEVGLPILRIKIVHKQANNPVLIDPDSGKPVRLFAGGRDGAGLEVGIDRRLGRKGKR